MKEDMKAQVEAWMAANNVKDASELSDNDLEQIAAGKGRNPGNVNINQVGGARASARAGGRRR